MIIYGSLTPKTLTEASLFWMEWNGTTRGKFSGGCFTEVASNLIESTAAITFQSVDNKDKWSKLERYTQIKVQPWQLHHGSTQTRGKIAVSYTDRRL